MTSHAIWNICNTTGVILHRFICSDISARLPVCRCPLCKQYFQPEGDSRSGFLPAGLPSFPVPPRVPGLAGSFLLIITPAFSRLKIGFTRGLNARLPAARADFYQRVRRLLTGGSLCPACALGGNRLAIFFQDEGFFQKSETTKAKHRFAAIPRFSLPTFFSREKKVGSQ